MFSSRNVHNIGSHLLDTVYPFLYCMLSNSNSESPEWDTIWKLYVTFCLLKMVKSPKFSFSSHVQLIYSQCVNM